MRSWLIRSRPKDFPIHGRRLMAAPVFVLAVLAGVTALLNKPPSWLAWFPHWAAVIALAVLGVLGTYLAKPWAKRRQAEQAKERQDLDRLKQYLGGRVKGLPLIGSPGASALDLGVHRAIPLGQFTGTSAGTAEGKNYLPAYVHRDIDRNVRDFLKICGRDGGFLLLVGNSSVGKTRLLYEAALDVLQDFYVLPLRGVDGDLVNKIAEAAFPLPKLIVWLDEMQQYLEGPYLAGKTPITLAAVRQLLASPTPVVILGSMWPEHRDRLTAVDADQSAGVRRYRYPGAAEILTDDRLQEWTLLSFSAAEREAAEKLSDADPRLAEALAVRDYGITEALAGVPELDRRYEQASEEQKAVLDAAVDARRLGVQAPLREELLCAAGRGYLDTLHPDDTWFPLAVAELTRHDGPADRAIAPLSQVLTDDRSSVVGYEVTDHLLQRLGRERRSQRVPAVAWEALGAHARERSDLMRLAGSAALRLHYCYAEPIYRQLADADPGDPVAAGLLDWLAAVRGDVEQLESRAAAGDEAAAQWVNEALAASGAVAKLQARADAGDQGAALALIDALAVRGATDQLAARADAGSVEAAMRLAEMLGDRGDVQRLQARADNGDGFAAVRLARRFSARGDLVQLKARADAGDRFAASLLCQCFAARGGIAQLRDLATHGNRTAANLLADQLAARGEVDELRARADAGDQSAAKYLSEMLAARGDLDQLRARADAGDQEAAQRLADLLAARGMVDQLRIRAAQGDHWASSYLAGSGLLADPGPQSPPNAEAAGIPDWILNPPRGDLTPDGISGIDDSVASAPSDLLAASLDLDRLRARADAGNLAAADQLAGLLYDRGDEDQLGARADAGDPYCAERLAQLLVLRIAVDRLEARADSGDPAAATQLARLLAARHDLDRLQARADAGDPYCARMMAGALVLQGEPDRLRARVDAGDQQAAAMILEYLADWGDRDAMEREIAAGNSPDIGHLADLWYHGDDDVAEFNRRLRRLGLRPGRASPTGSVVPERV